MTFIVYLLNISAQARKPMKNGDKLIIVIIIRDVLFIFCIIRQRWQRFALLIRDVLCIVCIFKRRRRRSEKKAFPTIGLGRNAASVASVGSFFACTRSNLGKYFTSYSSQQIQDNMNSEQANLCHEH